LDIADLYRDEVTLPVAFEAVKTLAKEPAQNIERLVRQVAGRQFREKQLIPGMIDKIKNIIEHEVEI
jgi:CRISPR-associated protein Cas1